MKHKNFFNTLTFLSLLFIFSCNSKTKKDPGKDLLKPSYKEQKKEGDFTEYFDTLSNIYSNYKYNIAVSSPKNWKHDEGVTEHMIFRSFDRDSGYSYSINVIETNYNIEDIFWKEYEKNSVVVENQFQGIFEKQVNSPVEVEYTIVTYLKNYKALKRKYNYSVRNEEFEIDMTSIMYQVPKGDFTYTIGLIIPTYFYEHRPEYFDNIIKNIYWLSNKKDVDDAFSDLN